MIHRPYPWFAHNAPEPGREPRLSFLAPLMVSAAYGIAGLTGIVGAVPSDPADS